MRYSIRSFLLVLVLIAGCGRLPAQDVAIDGRFADWDAMPALAGDPAHDGGPSGIDFTRVQVHDDALWLYLSFDTGIATLLQDNNGIRLAIDTDDDASTGRAMHGIGAELVWDFAQRQGTVYPGNSVNVRHDDIRLIPAPSMTSSRFELAIRRGTVIGTRPLFPVDRIRVALSDSGGDRFPDGDGGVEYEFRFTGVQPVVEQLLRPVENGAIRLLSWNTLFNGPVDPARQPAYTRLLRAIRPDVLCLQECFDMSASDALDVVRSAIDAPVGHEWRAIKRDAGNILVTHLDVEHSWQVQAEYRASAFQLRTPDGENLLLINAHFRCCDADDHRQREADGLIRFLRDAKTSGGVVTVPEGTPIVLVGDLNLVGDHRQYETLVTGDIVNNVTYGPDAAPDWDGGAWTELPPRHPSSRFTYTWDDVESSYAPATLDYLFYTASVLTVTHDLVVDPRQISPGQRLRLGINEHDATLASDHLPRFADIRWKRTSATEAAAPASWDIGDIYPNPAMRMLSLPVTGAPSGPPHLRLSDLLGRTVDLPAASFSGDLLRQPLPALAPGLYLLAITDGLRRILRPVLIR